MLEQRSPDTESGFSAVLQCQEARLGLGSAPTQKGSIGFLMLYEEAESSNPALLMRGTHWAQMLLSQHTAESSGKSQRLAFCLMWGFAEGMSVPKESLRNFHLQLAPSILRLWAGLRPQPCLNAWTAGTAPAAHPWPHLALLALLILLPHAPCPGAISASMG